VSTLNVVYPTLLHLLEGRTPKNCFLSTNGHCVWGLDLLETNIFDSRMA
jgi:hypothetical protein